MSPSERASPRPSVDGVHLDVVRELLRAAAALLPLLQDAGDVVGDVDARGIAGAHERVLEQPVVLGTLSLLLDEARVDELDEVLREALAGLGARLQARRVPVDHLLQLLEHTVPLRVRELAGRQLDQGDAWIANGRERGKRKISVIRKIEVKMTILLESRQTKY